MKINPTSISRNLPPLAVAFNGWRTSVHDCTGTEVKIMKINILTLPR